MNGYCCRCRRFRVIDVLCMCADCKTAWYTMRANRFNLPVRNHREVSP